jgi:hypothetical protein
MTNEEDEAEKAVLTWIGSEMADAAADYAARGRKFADLSVTELSNAWVQAFKACANSIHDHNLRSTQSDYASEFQLRGLVPPQELVQDDVETLTDNIKKWIESLTQDQEDELEHRVERDFEAFQTKIDREKH